jgi:stage II sporulation protein D
VTLPDAPERTTRSLSSEDETFTLTVPGKLTRTYRGALALTLAHGELIPVITMPTELAVASIVEAEAPPHASLEALKAQAVVSRSYLLAHPSGHTGFDACDTTHCQFLRSPPLAHSLASIATRATAGLVLTWRPSPESQPVIVPAMYARSCGGHTRAHPTTPEAYPFYRVACSFCQRHPEHWQRTIPSADAPQNERQRLAYNRIHGWSAVPSNQHASVEEHLEGTGTGHGIGLCQVGAADMAAHGATYEKVLTHFFPNTTLIRLP